MWEAIQANKRRSALLITVMAFVLMAMGAAFGFYLGGGAGAVFGIIAALVIWAVQMMVYFSGGGEAMLLRSARAQPIQKEDSPRLYNIVEEMSISSGLGFIPKIYIIDDPAPNAFAIGHKPESSAVAVTSGLIHRLDRDELQGVIAHEIAHLKNRDVKFMTLAAVMLGTIVILSEITMRSVFYGSRARSRSRSRGGDGQGILLLVALLVAILGPLMAQMLYFACSRKREYLADACGAQFTRYPEGLASALEKISSWKGEAAFASKATAPMFIINPLAASGGGGSLFATHPPAQERIRILRNMSGAGLGDYETAFRQAKGGALIGAQSLQQSSHEPVRAASGEGPIESRHETRDTIYRANGYVQLNCSCGMEIKVPESYNEVTVRCVRCGSVLPMPSASVMPPMAVPVAQPVEPQLRYTRKGSGWESFKCFCGRGVQLSPNFSGSHMNCPSCRRRIEIAARVS